jgi:hypothetical protein
MIVMKMIGLRLTTSRRAIARRWRPLIASNAIFTTRALRFSPSRRSGVRDRKCESAKVDRRPRTRGITDSCDGRDWNVEREHRLGAVNEHFLRHAPDATFRIGVSLGLRLQN